MACTLSSCVEAARFFFSLHFEGEPELLRLQMLEGRRCGGRQLYTHSGKRRGEAVLFDLRQLIAADCSQSSFRVAFRNQEE
jgi:hypothetical protein